jgi:serine/threonine protein phosphatase PrpC
MIEDGKLTNQLIGFKFCFDKIEGKGQDAEPSLIFSKDKCLLAVYDGMGSASIEYEFQEQIRASAYWASFFTKQQTELIFNEIINDTDSIERLEEQLKIELKSKIKILEKDPPRIKGNLANRRLPTTIAGILCDFTEFRKTIFWAGDSRCYLLNPNKCLQLTRDDVVTNSDALENLINDAPLSNFVNADLDFTIHQYTLNIESPCLLICATDGCFGYLDSPAHFEYYILKNLISSFNLDEWKAKLSDEFRKVASDDISLSLLVIGYDENNFDVLKSVFQNRFNDLNEKFILPIEKINESILEEEKIFFDLKDSINKLKNEKIELRKSLWDEYKQSYEYTIN